VNRIRLENWLSAPPMRARNSRTGEAFFAQVGIRSRGHWVRSRRPGREAVNAGRFPSVDPVARDGRAGCGQTGRSPFVGGTTSSGRSCRLVKTVHRIWSRVARQVGGRTVVCRTRTRSSDSPRWQTVRTGRPVRCRVVGHGSRWSRSAVRSIYAIESDGSRTDLTICHGSPFT
jgi:hypothetical protein